MRRLPPRAVGHWSHNGRVWILRVDGVEQGRLFRSRRRSKRPHWTVIDAAGWPVAGSWGKPRRVGMALIEQHVAWLAAQDKIVRGLWSLREGSTVDMGLETLVVVGDLRGQRAFYRMPKEEPFKLYVRPIVGVDSISFDLGTALR